MCSMMPTVLVVDDCPDMQRYLEYCIRSFSKVLASADGLDALEILKRVSVDLVMSDVSMPCMDGFQLCKAIHADPTLRQTPILLFTSHPPYALKQPITEAAADAVLTFPTAPNHLRQVVKQLLNLSD